MVVRMILRYLASNPEIVDRLSETWVIRRLAQLTAYSYFKAKEIGEDGLQKGVEKIKDSEILRKMEEIPPGDEDKMATFSRTFAKELREGMNDLSKKIEKDKEKDS